MNMRKIGVLFAVTIFVAIFSFTNISMAGDINNTGDNSSNASSDSGAIAGAQINNFGPEETNINAKGYRGFATPHDIPIVGQGPAHFNASTRGPLFQSMKKALIYKKLFTVDEINRMAKKSDVDVIPSPLIEKPNKEELAPGITVYLSKPDTPEMPAALIGFITVRADDKNTVSIKALAVAMKEAIAMGGNAIHVTAEGVKRQLRSFGWGVGMSHTTATMSMSEHTGTINSGGFGISGGHAGYVHYPWLQLTVLRIGMY